MRKKETFVGIDVAKKELEVAVLPGAGTETWPNTEEGIVRLVDYLKPLSPALIVLEATGGLEMPCVGGFGCRRTPRGRDEPKTDKGLRQSYRSASQD